MPANNRLSKDYQQLQQTKSNFVLRGIVTGKDTPSKANGYREGVIAQGKNKGKNYRSIRFSLKTSEENIIPVEMFGMERDKVYFYNKSERKTVPVDWNKRDMTPRDGYRLIPPEYDLIEKINNDFKDGDIVVAVGDIKVSTYLDKQNNTKQNTKYVLKRVNPSDAILDFTSDKFEELNNFEQEVIIDSIVHEEGKVIVSAFVINFGDQVVNTELEINTKTANPAFVRNIKTLKFGDFIKFKGVIKKRILNEKIDGAWGTEVIRDYIDSREILSADPETLEKSKYKEEDLITQSTDEVDWSKIASNDKSELPFTLE